MSKKTKTNEPVKFDIFYESLKSTVDSNKSSAVSESFALIKKGFSDESNKERVDKILELLFDWTAVDKLAVKLTVGKYSEKLKSSFAVQISNLLRMRFRTKLEYPLPENSRSVSIDEVIHWLNQATNLEQSKDSKEENNEGKQSSNFCLPDTILRIKFVCLFGELNDNDLCKAIDILLETYIKSTDKNYGATRNSYIDAVGALLLQKLSTSAIKNLLVSSSVLKKDIFELQHAENSLRQNLRNSENRLKDLEIEKSNLQDQLTNVNAENDKLKVDAEKNKQEIKDWEGRNESLEKYWQRTLKQEMMGQSAHIRNNVNHQIAQLRLCLDDKTPDIETALIFIKRIEKIVGETDGNK